jgi:hypothetical protein
MWRRVTWTTLHNRSCRDAQIDPFGRMTDGHVVDQFADQSLNQAAVCAFSLTSLVAQRDAG